MGLSILVYLFQFSLSPQEAEVFIYKFGLIPIRFFGGAQLTPELAAIPAPATMFTAMFMHGGILHLAGNMLFLWIFGDNVEDQMGHFRFVLFYLLCGVAASLAHGFLNSASQIPMIGASGAISGVLGAYLLLHPMANVRVLIFVVFFVTIINVPAFMAIGIWFIGQLLSAVATPAGQPGVAFWAHIGGFIAGTVFVYFFKEKGVELLQKPRSRMFKAETRRGPWG